MWNAEGIANISAESVNLKDGSGRFFGNVPVAFAKMLVEIKTKIQTVAGIQSDLYIQVGTDPNAWAGPVGNRYVIAFNLPMLVAFGNDKDALATVMGHETAHLVRQHIPARQGNQNTVDAFGSFFGALFEGVIQNKYQISGLGNSIAELCVVMAKTAFSRDQEREADKYGLEWMNAAGYSPQGALRLWKKMGSIAPGRDFTFLLSHPASDERFENLKQQISSLPPQRNEIHSNSSYQIAIGGSNAQTRNAITVTGMEQDANSLANQNGVVKTGFCIQIAAVFDQDLARLMRSQIAARGFDVYTEVARGPNGEFTRVRSGPYSTRELAENARNQLKNRGFSGAILPLQ